MLFWGIWASIPTKNSENKTLCVFFHCAFDGNAPGRRNTTQKSKNNEQQKKNMKIENFVRVDAPMYFLEVSTPGTAPKYPKNPIFLKLRFL